MSANDKAAIIDSVETQVRGKRQALTAQSRYAAAAPGNGGG